jgi:Ohr subfamily peroxiredoxin
LYRTQATAIGGGIGSAASADGALRLDLATPAELGGPGGRGTNPEQLFAAGYAASFLSALREVGRERIAPDANVTATVRVGGRAEGEGRSFDVTLDVDLPGMQEGEAQALAARAHAICAYSLAVQGNLRVRVTIQ